jgi:hypothetical protein
MASREPLPLWPGAQSCVQSGYCCTVAPCPFGTWDAERHQCAHLAEPDTAGRRACAIYADILGKAGWELAPAFGAGCCSPLNSRRREILR